MRCFILLLLLVLNVSTLQAQVFQPLRVEAKDYPYSSNWRLAQRALVLDGLYASAPITALFGFFQTDPLFFSGWPQIQTRDSARAIVRCRQNDLGLGGVEDLALALIIRDRRGNSELVYQGEFPSNPPGIPTEWINIEFKIGARTFLSDLSFGVLATSGLLNPVEIEVDAFWIEE